MKMVSQSRIKISEEIARRYIAEMLDQMADIAENIADEDMGHLAFQLRLLSSKAATPRVSDKAC